MFNYMTALYGLYVSEDKSDGQGMVEYALILALVSVIAIAALLLLGPKIASIFTSVTDSLGAA